MHVLRAVLGLIAILASGCLIGFDANRLTGGRDAGSGAGAASGAADTPTVDMGAAACNVLSTYTPGQSLTNWVEGRGSWLVATTAQGKALIQTDSSSGRHDRFFAWRDAYDVADTTVSAVVMLDGNPTDLNCVMARVVDAYNYYALCVEEVGGRNGPATLQWSVYSVLQGSENELASAPIATALVHSLQLRTQGNMLLPTVDGVAQPAVTDDSLSDGSVGVATDNGGGFLSLCTGGP
jgi:hypothetical protein